MRGSVNDWLRTILFLPPQASTIAPSIDHLHFFVIIVTMCGATAIALLAAFFIIRYGRRPRWATPEPEQPAPAIPLWLESTLIGGLFALFFAWWVVGYMQYLRARVPPAGTYDIYVTAKQWMWKFAYREGAQSITQLYIPTGRPVRLLMTSRDVIHSFYVPDFRVKQDVLPGRYTTAWFTVPVAGVHDILCAEYCGTNHSMMRGQVIALDPADFARWIEGGTVANGGEPEAAALEPPFREDPQVATDLGPTKLLSLPELGRRVAAQQGCLRCHSLDGTPHVGPTWAGLFGAEVPLSGGGTVHADEAYLTESMMDPLARIHNGFKAVMPSYLGRLRPGETAALIELIRSLRDARGQEPEQGAAPTEPQPPAQPQPAGAIGQPELDGGLL